MRVLPLFMLKLFVDAAWKSKGILPVQLMVMPFVCAEGLLPPLNTEPKSTAVLLFVMVQPELMVSLTSKDEPAEVPAIAAGAEWIDRAAKAAMAWLGLMD